MAVTIDGSDAGAATQVSHTTLSWARAISASSTEIIVSVGVDNLNGLPAAGDVSVTVGGTNAPEDASSPVANGNAGQYIFKLATPPSGGSVTIAATVGSNGSNSDSINGGSVSFLGSTGVGTPVTVANGVASSITLTPAGVAATSQVVAFCSCGDDINSPSPGTSQFILNTETAGSGGCMAGATNTGTGSVSVTWGGMPAGDSHGGWAAEVQGAAAAASPVPLPRSRGARPRLYKYRYATRLAFPAAGGVTVPGAATLAGTGSLTNTAVQVEDTTATVLSGTGSLTAAVTQGAGATLSGTGSLNAPHVIQGAGATPGGAGSLTNAATEAPGAILGGAGSAGDTAVQGSGATLAAAGSLAAVAIVGVFGTAALSGTGSLTALVTEAPGAVLSGAGSTGDTATQGSGATLAGAGSLTASAVVGVFGAATLSGTGSLNAPDVIQGVIATLAGAGSLTNTAVQAVIVTLHGTGSLTGAATVFALGAATLTGTGSLTALALQQATAVLNGTGSLTGTGIAIAPFTVGRLTQAAAASTMTAATASSKTTAATASTAALTSGRSRTGGPS